MLRFKVFDENGPASQWPLVCAHLMGPEDVAVPGKIEFEDGCIVCRRQGTHAVALGLQYDAGPMGRLIQQTCLLPDREEPYLLSVELARHRIKTFIVKCEEWQLFDLGEEHPAVKRWEQARQIFTRALTGDDPLVVDRSAQQALIYAIEATERLALAHAELLLHRRYAQRAASSVTLGVRVWPGRDPRPMKELVEKEFDVLLLPLRWKELEVEEGKYNWEPVDRWVQWAKSTGKHIMAGPLLDFSKAALPEWMYVWQHDYDTCRDLAYDHIEKVVRRYRSVVGMWNLASGLNANDNFQFSSEQMIDLVRMAGLLVRQVAGARSMVEIVQPFGESAGTCRDALPPMAFLDRLLQEGIRIDAVGVQLLFGSIKPGQAARDLMQISHMLDRFFLLELPVLVSAAGVPSEPVDEKAGWWHDAWSVEEQAKWSTRVFAMSMSKPFVESIFWTNLFDHPGADIPSGGLIDAEGKPKLTLQKLLAFRKRLRRPLGTARSPLIVNPSAAS